MSSVAEQQGISIAEEKAGIPTDQPAPARVNDASRGAAEAVSGASRGAAEAVSGASRGAAEAVSEQETPARPAGGAQRGSPARRLGGQLTRPATGAAVAGAVVLGAAVIWGALEAALGAGAAYVTYRILKKRRTPPRQSGSFDKPAQ